MDPESDCPLCHKVASEPLYSDGAVTHVKCPRCGTFRVSDSCLPSLRERSAVHRHGLSVDARQASERGQPLQINWLNIDRLIADHLPFTIQRKRRAILEFVRRESENEFGRIVPIEPPSHYPLFGSKPEETSNLISSLTAAGEELLYRESSDRGFSLTVKGWDVTDPVSGGAEPGTCFVAMRFGRPDLDRVYEEGILKAAAGQECRLNVIRVDRQHSNEKIDDRIVRGLRRAEVTIAEVTDPNAGAYFEAGFALALGREVVFCCQRDAFADGRGVHFDTRTYPYIVWTNAEDLRSQLVLRLLNTVPSLVSSSMRRL